MNSDLCTLGAMALVLLFGWLLDHQDIWRRARLLLLRPDDRSTRATAAGGWPAGPRR